MTGSIGVELGSQKKLHHYAEQNPAVFGKREVILSLYLKGE
jgi:hypothetical protein